MGNIIKHRREILVRRSDVTDVIDILSKYKICRFADCGKIFFINRFSIVKVGKYVRSGKYWYIRFTSTDKIYGKIIKNITEKQIKLVSPTVRYLGGS